MNRGTRSALGALVVLLLASTLLWTVGSGAGTTALALPQQVTAVAGVTSSAAIAQPASADVTAIQSLLNRRGAAVLGRDRSGFVADLGEQRPGFRERQSALFANLAQVPLQSWSYRISRSALLPNAPQVSGGAPAGQQTLTFRAELSYQLAGFDEYPDVHPVILTFTRMAAAAPWKLISDSDYDQLGTPTWRGLWDFGPVVAVRSTYGLLLAHPGQAKVLAAFGRAVDKAVPAVRAGWGDSGWSGRVVVLIPGSSSELARVGSVGVGLDRLAALAVATSVDVSASKATGQRVLINPAALAKLAAPAALSLMTHEITHVAARASTREGTPTWLVEGLADFVAYSGDYRPKRVAATLAAQVQTGDIPEALPTDAQFHAGADSLNAVYAQAWLACKYIAGRIGIGGLIALYRTVAGSADPGPTLAEQLATRLGQTKSQFKAAWIGYLKAQLG